MGDGPFEVPLQVRTHPLLPPSASGLTWMDPRQVVCMVGAAAGFLDFGFDVRQSYSPVLRCSSARSDPPSPPPGSLQGTANCVLIRILSFFAAFSWAASCALRQVSIAEQPV